MLYPTKEQSDAMRRCALFLERRNYGQIKSFLKSSSQREYAFFWQFFLDDDLLYEVARDKDRLATLVAKSCNISALPEDRARIVFIIAKLGDNDLTNINNSLIKEFGPHFKLLDKYATYGKVVNWRDIIQRAREIRNGYINIANLAVESQVITMMRYYQMSKDTDVEKVSYLNELANKILSKSINNSSLPLSSPSLADVVPLITEFYKATNRLQLDIDRLLEAPAIEEAVLHITITNTILETKLRLTKKGIPLTDLNEVENEIRKTMRELYFNSSLISLEEMQRAHIPLQLIGTSKT